MDSIKDYIIFQDHHLVVCNKPAGMPVQEDLSKDPSLHRLLQSYCKLDLFLCHRIDRPVSGLVVMAKNANDASLLSKQLLAKKFKKSYLAIVEKNEIASEGVLINKLSKSSHKKKSYVDELSGDKESRLDYKLILNLDQYHVLEINLSTGRFHQIRAQLAHAGMAIKGDVKYGARRSNKDRSIGLHSWKSDFIHPSLHQAVSFVAPLPANDIWPIIQAKLQEL